MFAFLISKQSCRVNDLKKMKIYSLLIVIYGVIYAGLPCSRAVL